MCTWTPPPPPSPPPSPRTVVVIVAGDAAWEVKERGTMRGRVASHERIFSFSEKQI
jgi:hypothetical protein